MYVGRDCRNSCLFVMTTKSRQGALSRKDEDSLKGLQYTAFTAELQYRNVRPVFLLPKWTGDHRLGLATKKRQRMKNR